MKNYLTLPLITNKQLEIINGSMLGDGSLRHLQNRPNQNWSFTLGQSQSDKNGVDKKDYLQFIFDELNPYSSRISSAIIKGCQSNFTLKKDEYYKYTYATHAHPFWTGLGQKWYLWKDYELIFNKIGRKIKVVPGDLRLTPLTACIWFMEDGFNYSKDGNAVLCTQGFAVDECLFLIERLKQDLSIRSHLRFTSLGHLPFIFIGIKTWRDFIGIIKPHVKWDCFEYKTSTKAYVKICRIGEHHHLSKLSEDEVKEIFKLYNEGCSQKEISQRFGINSATVSNILTGKLWSHLNIPSKPKSNYMKPHLTTEQKDVVIEMLKSGLSQSQIAREMKINQATVSRLSKKVQVVE